MAITRLHQTGFELEELLREVTAVSDSAVVLTTAQKKTGNYSLLIPNTNNRYAYIQFSSSYDQMRSGFHFRNSTPAGTEAPDLIAFYDIATIRFRVRYNAANNLIEAVGGASTVIASGSYVPFLTPETWFHISVDFYRNASGWIRVYIDGNSVINFSGNTTAISGSSNRVVYGNITSNQNWTTSTYYDDIHIDDTTGEVAATFAPDYRYDTILVAGNGVESDWVGNDGNSVDNYLLVDDVPNDGDSTYVDAAIAGERDFYEMNTITLPVGWSIASIIPIAFVKKDAAPTTLGVKLATRVATDEQQSATKIVGTDYTYVWDRQTQQPVGGAWDQAALDALQIGIESA